MAYQLPDQDKVSSSSFSCPPCPNRTSTSPQPQPSCSHGPFRHLHVCVGLGFDLRCTCVSSFCFPSVHHPGRSCVWWVWRPWESPFLISIVRPYVQTRFYPRERQRSLFNNSILFKFYVYQYVYQYQSMMQSHSQANSRSAQTRIRMKKTQDHRHTAHGPSPLDVFPKANVSPLYISTTRSPARPPSGLSSSYDRNHTPRPRSCLRTSVVVK